MYVGVMVLGWTVGAAAATDTAVKPAITSLVLAPDGKSCVYASQAGVRVQAFGGKDVRTLATTLDHIHALAFSPDGKTLAVGGGSPAEKGIVELLTYPEGKLLGKLEGHADVVHDIVWLEGGKLLATASADRTLRLWEAAIRREVAKLTGHSGPVLALAISPDGRWLCSGSADQTVRVWDPVKHTLVRSMTNHLGPVHRLAFRPGKHQQPYLASAGGDGTVRIWQPGIGRLVRIFRHPAPVFAVSWSGDGEYLVSGARDGTLRTFPSDSDRTVREETISAERITCILQAPNGWLTAAEGTIRASKK